MEFTMLRLLLPVVQELLIIVAWVRLLFIGRADLAEGISSEIVVDPVEVIHNEHLLGVGRRP